MSYYSPENLSNRVDNTNDLIDVRDVIERYEELVSELTEVHELHFHKFLPDLWEWIEHTRDNSDTVYIALAGNADIDAYEVVSNCEEIYKLGELLDDLAGNGGDHEWEGKWYPVTLIRDTYFRDYAEELASDIGAIDPRATWPNNCIDWDRATRELQIDYTTVEYDGETYWYR